MSLLLAVVSAVVSTGASSELVSNGVAGVCDGFPARPTPAAVGETCSSFCSSSCSFLNKTAGDDGAPTTVTLYRVTPRNVTDLRDKNTGSAAGDLTFRYSAMLGGAGAFLAGDNVVGKFSVVVDGKWGPYKQCNPKYGWDTTEWFCENDCETPPYCNATSWQNKSNDFTGIYCECPRANTTVGRLDMGAADTRYTKARQEPGWPAQCDLTFQRIDGSSAASAPRSTSLSLSHRGSDSNPPPPPPPPACFYGDVAQNLTASTHDELIALLCEACSGDVKCDGWAIHGGSSSTTGATYHHKQQPITDGRPCIAAARGIPSWINVGGYWYNTPSKGECKGDATPGDGSGCTWMLAKETAPVYINQSCLDAHVDAVVHEAGKECFDGCGAGSSHNSTCWVRCYALTVEGDAYSHEKAVPASTLTNAWAAAFEGEDPTHGGCPHEPLVYV